MVSRASTRRGLLVVGLLVVVLLGVMDVLLREGESLPASLWNRINPAGTTPRTPLDRVRERLPPPR